MTCDKTDFFAFSCSVELLCEKSVASPELSCFRVICRGKGGSGTLELAVLAIEGDLEPATLLREGKAGGGTPRDSLEDLFVNVRVGKGGGKAPGIDRGTGLLAGVGRDLLTRTGSPFDFQGFAALSGFNIASLGILNSDLEER